MFEIYSKHHYIILLNVLLYLINIVFLLIKHFSLIHFEILSLKIPLQHLLIAVGAFIFNRSAFLPLSFCSGLATELFDFDFRFLWGICSRAISFLLSSFRSFIYIGLCLYPSQLWAEGWSIMPFYLLFSKNLLSINFLQETIWSFSVVAQINRTSLFSLNWVDAKSF